MIDVATDFSINLFDIMVIGVIFTFAVIAAYRGFVPELFSIFVWLSAVLITLYFVADVATAMLPFLKTPFAATIFATLGTLTLAFFTFSALNTSILQKYIRPTGDVGKLDNVVGFVFGVVKGWFLTVLAFIIVTVTVGTNKNDYPEWVINSYTLPAVERTAEWIAERMPEYLPLPTTEFSEGQTQADREKVDTMITIPERPEE